MHETGRYSNFTNLVNSDIILIIFHIVHGVFFIFQVNSKYRYSDCDRELCVCVCMDGICTICIYISKFFIIICLVMHVYISVTLIGLDMTQWTRINGLQNCPCIVLVIWDYLDIQDCLEGPEQYWLKNVCHQMCLKVMKPLNIHMFGNPSFCSGILSTAIV